MSEEFIIMAELSVTELITAGKELGLSGSDLQAFLKYEQDMAREKRAEERDLRLRVAEDERKRAEAELEAKRLELQISQLPGQLTGGPRQSTAKVKLPVFQEDQDDMDAYLARYERYASTQGWKKEEWATHLSMLLTGKGLQAFVSMTTDDSRDYDKVKDTLMRRYMLTEEGFRKKFRSAKPESDETVQQFVSRLRRYLAKWIDLSKIDKTYDGLVDLFLREQFMLKCSSDLAIFLKDRTPKDMNEAEALAERYLDTRSSTLAPKTPVKTSTPSSSDLKGTSVYKYAGNSTPKGISVQKEKRVCFLCNKFGHIARDCHAFGRTQKIAKNLPTETREVKEERVAAFEEGGVVQLSTGEKLPLVASVCEAKEGLKVVKGYIGHQEVDVIRDTGCTGVVVKREFIKPEELTGGIRKCVLVDKTVRICPVARLNINTPYFRGEVMATCLNDAVCDLIIGNITGATIGEDYNVLAAATTRSMAQKNKSLAPLKVPVAQLPQGPQTVEELKEAQNNDSTLDSLRKHVGKAPRGRGHAKIINVDGILYRLLIRDGEVQQVVVPELWRPQVLQLAHEGLMGGHLGIKKTSDRILSSFYWPGIYGDVKRYCRSCDVCQRTIPQGKVTKVPLGEVPLIDAPFKKIAVDLVGPLEPKTDRGNRYILTLVDYGTRYPEAVPLPSIETERVAEAMLDVFSRVGIPEEILSDRGTQFTSDLMKEICRLISVKQIHTTPYNPRHNGLNERFNGTLKTMLKRMCTERPRDWDRYLPALLFAYWEVPQASTGFAPFELLYGRAVRGPMRILKELWTGPGEEEEYTTYQYIFDLRNKLEDTCRLAQEKLAEAGESYRRHYDKKTKPRKLNVGDKALLLLPTDRNKLLLQWKGPFEVTKVVSATNYRVKIGNHEKTFHINLLKKYEEADDLRCDQVAALSVVQEEDQGEMLHHPGLEDTETIDDVHICPELPLEKQLQVKVILQEYEDIFSNLPGLTHLEEHKIEVTSDQPVYVKPYALPHATQENVRQEVIKMMNMGIIERAHSPYNAPVVLVKKKDGTVRFCVNYKQLNKVTVFDTEPMNRPEDIIARLQGKKYFSSFDFTKGYWQIPMDPESKAKTAFSTPEGSFQFVRMPFGLVCSPATYNRMMRKLNSGKHNRDNYMDDLLVHNTDWQTHLGTLSQFFQDVRDAGLTVRPTKCFIGYNSLEYLGLRIGENQIGIDDDKVKKVLDADPPQTKKQVRAFLGMTGWYRKFIPDYSTIATPLTDLTKKLMPNLVQWKAEHQEAFDHLKQKICQAPVLRMPDFHRQFILQTDASSTGLGAVLAQEFQDGIFPISFASRKLTARERNYATVEREGLAVVFGVKHFENYLYGTHFVVCTDHRALEFMNQKTVDNCRILRWSLFLQNFNFTVKAIRGEDNVIADYLSRI